MERRRHQDPADLVCPRCGVRIKPRLPSLAVEHCPRCIARSRVAVTLVASRAEILTENIGPATAAIMQRIAGMPDPPPRESDEALAAIDRVVLAITIEAVSAVNYLDPADAT